MEEGRYTVDGDTRELPKPFIVIATQNPFGSAGTQRLPQSQIERFMIRTSIGYPDAESEIDIMKDAKDNKLDKLNNIISAKELMDCINTADNIYVKDNIYKFIVNIVNATRNNKYLSLGISPRGSIAILKMAKACALYNGREFVSADNVMDIIKCTACHRIELNNDARAEGISEEKIIDSIVKEIRL